MPYIYREKGVYSKYTVHNSIIFGIQWLKFKFGSIYIFILKHMYFILLIYLSSTLFLCQNINEISTFSQAKYYFNNL